MKRILVFPVGVFLTISLVHGQHDFDVVIAQPGDGIFSILRKQGLDPAKYYQDFVELNIDDIRNGSELHVGKTYKVPNAPDSFKNMARYVLLTDQTEVPIFDAELASLTLKSDKLGNAVYYLISEDGQAGNKFTAQVVINLAKELMVNGAKVYVLTKAKVAGNLSNFPNGQNTLSKAEEMPLDNINNLQQYVDAVNKRYLKNRGSYQRLLVIRANGLTTSKTLNVSVYHHKSSSSGEKFAENIKNAFQGYRIQQDIQKSPQVFAHKNNLFLAKNALPTLTLVEVADSSRRTQSKISVKSDKKAITDWLANGMLKDYADLQINED
ncbi:MAG: hypothetical protein AAGB24_12715 [Bacteroidota bacterium]